VDFRNTIIIMTSNVGTRHISGDAGERRKIIMDALREHFRPEFLNRVDEVVVFNDLSRENLKKIIDIQLRDLRERLGARNIRLELTDGAKEYVAEQGYDPAYGARPIKRAIQRLLVNPLSRRILDSEIRDGASVKVGLEKEAGETRLKFEKV